MSGRELVIVDYGVGNLRNVYKAVEAAGGQPWVVNQPAALAQAAGVILPGVGAFGDAAANLRAAGFEEPLREAVVAGKPFLGICVGMQLLFDESEEMGRHPGLGLIPGRVVRFSNDMAGPDGKPLKVPEIGWNQLHHDRGRPVARWGSKMAYTPTSSTLITAGPRARRIRSRAPITASTTRLW